MALAAAPAAASHADITTIVDGGSAWIADCNNAPTQIRLDQRIVARSAVDVARSRVFIVTETGALHRIEARSGHSVARQQLKHAPVHGVVATSDGRYAIVAAGSKPSHILVFDAASLEPVGSRVVTGRDGRPFTVTALHHASPRKSVIALMADGNEAWEMSYDANAEPVYEGYVHDYRLREGIATEGLLPPRRIALEPPITNIAFDARFDHAVIYQPRERSISVINLNVRRRIATIATQARHPLLASSNTTGERPLFWVAEQGGGEVWPFDPQSWSLLDPVAAGGAVRAFLVGAAHRPAYALVNESPDQLALIRLAAYKTAGTRWQLGRGAVASTVTLTPGGGCVMWLERTDGVLALVRQPTADTQLDAAPDRYLLR